ncbi:hypothetical protein [Acinetobacter oleivorans]|uniref:hypothetical protein n=1 Tax=Acinetobacter oleivorans TaxID=1148157 RepID=UPI003A83FCC7
MTEIISLIANICTILGFFIALITLIYFFLEHNNKLMIETRKRFLEQESWTNEGDYSSTDSVFFTIYIHNSKSHIFNGTIVLNSYSKELDFYFEKAFRRSFMIRIHKWQGRREVDYARAKIKMKTPDTFEIVFIKGFELDDFKPQFPYKTEIW